jgi:hypothetical protein
MRPKLAIWAPWSACILSITLAPGSAGASHEIGLGISYDGRVPVGSFRNFLENPAWQGLQGQLDYFIADRLSLGVGLQYNLFRQQSPPQTVQIAGGAITATTFRAAEMWSIWPSTRVYLLPRKDVRPYVGLAIGATQVIHTLLTSDIVQTGDQWFLIVQPSAGLFFRFGPPREHGLREDPAVGALIAMTYAFTTASFLDVSNLSYFGTQIGIYAKY